MARQFNHARVNMQKRISYESRIYDRPPPYSGQSSYDSSTYNNSTYASSPFDRSSPVKWLKIYFGKHSGKTLPETLFRDIGYLNWLIANDVLYKAIAKKKATPYQIIIAHQLKVIANRAQHILPPKHRRKMREFAIVVDREGVFERFYLVKKNGMPKRKLSPGSKIVKRVSELDVTIVFQYKNPDLGCKRMANCLTRTYFSSEILEPTSEDFGRFLMDLDNFDLSCLTSHVNVRPSRPDHKKLKAEYLRSQLH